MLQYSNVNRMKGQSPLAELNREMDRFFSDVWGTQLADRDFSGHWLPACDIEEEKDHYLLSVDLPGVSKDAVKLELHENQLLISGERSETKKQEAEGRYYSERRYGKFERAFRLPEGIDSSRVEAHHENGVLRVYVPKAEVKKPKQIEISTGKNTEGGFFSRLLGQAPKTEDRVA